MTLIFKLLPKPKHLVPAVFLHIQKTAGTSITSTLRWRYRNDFISHGDYTNWNKKDLLGVSFVSGHFGFDFARELIASRYSFTFLRDPVDRLLSLYYHSNTFKENFPIYNLAKEHDLESFLRLGLQEGGEIRSHLWNHQTWSLACGWGNGLGLNPSDFEESELLHQATDHLNKFSHVGFLRTYDEDLEDILNALNVGMPKIIRNIKWNRASIRRHQPELSNVAIEILTELTHLDRQLYERAIKAFGRTQLN